jgi:thiosulfate dehydrogenase (quinone) large subunit
MVSAFAHALPWLEAVIGLLLILGAATRLALSAGALLILALTFGSTLHQDWDVAGLQLIYAAVYAALLVFRDNNAFSVDGAWSWKQLS